jgi:hypothetical protein
VSEGGAEREPAGEIPSATRDLKFGGPGRDRTDDLFHAMERQKQQLADGKDFNSRMSRQKPSKSARFATKMLPKRVLPICYQTDFWAEG